MPADSSIIRVIRPVSSKFFITRSNDRMKAAISRSVKPRTTYMCSGLRPGSVRFALASRSSNKGCQSNLS